MVKLACMTWLYNEYSFERALAGISGAGYRYVALGLPHEGSDVPDENDEQSVSKVKGLLDQYGLQPTMLVGNRQFKPDQPLERAIKRLQTAKELGITEVLSVGTTSYRKFPDAPYTEEEMAPVNEKFANHFRKIADEAAKLGIVLTLKPHTGNTATAAVIMKTLLEIDRPNVWGSYDPGNVQYYEGVNAAEDFPQMAARTHSLIIKDHRGERAVRDFPLPGNGDVDFSQLFAALKQVGFDGNIFVERVATGFSDPAEVIDQKLVESRIYLERTIKEAGLEI